LKKLREWGGRYLPGEIAGTLSAVTGALLAQHLIGNDAITAFVGTWSENIGFYGYTITREFRNLARQSGKPFRLHGSGRTFYQLARNIIVEFGSAELFDSFLLRPFFLYSALKLVGNPSIGLVVGKLTADLAFYGITITAYELKKKYFKAA